MYFLKHFITRWQFQCFVNFFVSIDLVEYSAVKVSGLWTADHQLFYLFLKSKFFIKNCIFLQPIWHINVQVLLMHKLSIIIKYLWWFENLFQSEVSLNFCDFPHITVEWNSKTEDWFIFDTCTSIYSIWRFNLPNIPNA